MQNEEIKEGEGALEEAKADEESSEEAETVAGAEGLEKEPDVE